MAAERMSFDELQRAVAEQTFRRSLTEVLTRHSPDQAPCIIAETKKASPTAGVLREDYDPGQIAGEYERAGAVGVSVITEPNYFLGAGDHLRVVREAVSLPVLRKDFISTPYQVYESAFCGADAILLIAAALDFLRLRDLYIVALAIGLEVIVEVHSLEELEMVLPLRNVILGVNSRNLRTLQVDLAVAKEVAAHIPADRVSIAESGIKTRRDVEDLLRVGYKGLLVGETLMRSGNVGLMLRTLMGTPRPAK